MNVRPTEPQIMRWTRRSWMRLATINALMSIAALILSTHLSEHMSALVRLGAQIQFMHSMASIACATFMNVGAGSARHAPAFLLGGSLLFALLHYGVALGFWGLANWMTAIAGGLMASGWAIMFVTGRNID